MPSTRSTIIAACLTALAGSAACHRRAALSPTASAQPVMPADASMPAAMPAPTPRERVGYTEADVRFMQGMIAHHGQAVVMTALVPTHSTRSDVQNIAERISASQSTEIGQMRRWLESRHEQAPASGGMHDMAAMDHDMAGMHHDMAGMAAMHADSSGMAMTMPGMLTAAELAQLSAASGAEFDQLFLRYMIRHHEGALTMVAKLFASPGSGQESQLFGLASDVDSGQRAEIARMQQLQRASH